MTKEESHANRNKLMQTWASLGAELLVARSRPLVDWSAAKRMIDAVRPKMEAEAARLRSLMVSSRKKLAPLEEPFDFDLGLHRWLDAEREEAYSDWFEWVICQAKTPVRVFRLFGMKPPETLNETAILDVKREFRIPHGHLDQTGRLDLVISFGDQAIIAIEVKKGDADEADTEKHGGYSNWLNGQTHGFRQGVFLALSAEEKDYHGFPFHSWADVCIEMRLLAMELCEENRVTAAAMVLAFTAAVEQNLLGFSAEAARRVCEGNSHFVNSLVSDHLLNFLKKTEV